MPPTHGIGLGMFATQLATKARCLLGASERPRQGSRASDGGRRIGSSQNTGAIDSQASDLAAEKGNSNNNGLVVVYRNSNGRSRRDALRSLSSDWQDTSGTARTGLIQRIPNPSRLFWPSIYALRGRSSTEANPRRI